METRWRKIPSLTAVAVALALVGCAPARQAAVPVADDISRRAAVQTFTDGYKGVTQKYIDPVRVQDLAVEGLRGLGTIDPVLTVARSGATVVLAAGGREVARFPVPSDGDVGGWAALTADVSAAGRTASAELKGADMEKVYQAVFDRVLSSLDPFSRYAGAEEAKKNRARREGFGGIGIRFATKDGTVRVVSVMDGTPAAKAGIRANDRITHVDGYPTEGMDNDRVIGVLRGPVKSRVVVTIRRDGVDRPLRFEIERAHVIPNTVIARKEEGILHLRVTNFNQNTARSMAQLLRKRNRRPSEAPRGIILDLRGNPGGLLKQSIRVADLFLSEGEISSTKGRHPDSLHHYEAGGGDLAKGLPVAVLVDGKSASAAEIVAAALQDRGRAVLIGTTSYGKGTVQTVIRLPNDGELTLTWSRFMAPSGYALHGLGVFPSICTSGAKVKAARLIEMALARRLITTDTMAAWRRVDIAEEERRHDLRESCPPQRRLGPTEVEVARRLLTDRTLYAQALDLASPTATASTQRGHP